VFQLSDRLESTLEITRQEVREAHEKVKDCCFRKARRSVENGTKVLVLLPTDNKLLLQ